MASHDDRAELISMFIESVLYGLYVASFVCTIYVLIYKRSSRHVHYGMFLVTVAMFALATMHLLINLLHLNDALSLYQSHPGATDILSNNFSSFKNLFRTGVILSEIILGDIVLIYRCYIAWGSLRIIILPLIVLLGTAVTSGGIVYTFSHTPSGSDFFGVKRLQTFIICTQVLVFMNNVICTCLLAWKIWRMSRAVVSREQRQGLRSVARIIAESGFITAVAWIIYITLNALRQPASFIVLNALAPITGGAFCLIVSRVALNKDIQKPPRDTIHHRGVSSDDTAATATGPSCNCTCTCSCPACCRYGPRDSDSDVSMSGRTRIRTRARIGGRGRGGGDGTRSVLPVLDGTGRPHRPMEINVSSHESVRVDMQEMGMVADGMYKDKMFIAELAHL